MAPLMIILMDIICSCHLARINPCGVLGVWHAVPVHPGQDHHGDGEYGQQSVDHGRGGVEVSAKVEYGLCRPFVYFSMGNSFVNDVFGDIHPSSGDDSMANEMNSRLHLWLSMLGA